LSYYWRNYFRCCWSGGSSKKGTCFLVSVRPRTRRNDADIICIIVADFGKLSRQSSANWIKRHRIALLAGGACSILIMDNGWRLGSFYS
jgi:hypothetical protein